MAKYPKPEPGYQTPAKRRWQLIRWLLIVIAAALILYKMWTEFG